MSDLGRGLQIGPDQERFAKERAVVIALGMPDQLPVFV
jgi:hypothetical protein